MQTIGNVCPSSKSEEESNASFLRTSCDGEGNNSTEVPDVTLPKKASSEKTAARTANRHR